MRIRIIINDISLEWTTEGREKIQTEIIKKLFDYERGISRNKTDAVYNVAAIMNLSVATVWKTIKVYNNCKK